MTGATAQNARRGRPPLGQSHRREDIVRVAANLADREGWPGLTMARVARELGRHTTSMYAHFRGLDDLRKAIAIASATELADNVWSATIGKVGEEALMAIALEYRSYAAIFPGRTSSLSAVDRHDPEFAKAMAHLHQPIAATFRTFGLDESGAATAHQIFGALINGLANTGGMGELEQAVNLFVIGMSTGTWPVFG